MDSDDRFHLHISRRAMATEFQVLLPRSLTPAQLDAAVMAMEMLEEIESVMTVYQRESEISRLNRDAARGPVKVSAMVIDVLQRAVRLSAATEGAFDVTAGPLVDAWGFTTRSGRRPSDKQVLAARAHVGWQHLEIDQSSRTVRFAVPEMRINLGAIGKGYALDRIAMRIRDAGIEDFLLHGGNSSVIAWGNSEAELGGAPEVGGAPELGGEETSEDRPRAGGGGGWRIGLRHPTRPHLRSGGIVLRQAALATSGSGKQHFHFRGRRYGHVIDPRTGYPVGEFLSLSVITPGATEADAIATGLYVGGRELISRYAAEHPDHAVIAIGAGKREGSTQTETWNAVGDVWSEQQDDR